MITVTTVLGSSGGRTGGPMQWISDQRRPVPNGGIVPGTSWSVSSEDASYKGISADPSSDAAVDVGSSHSHSAS